MKEEKPAEKEKLSLIADICCSVCNGKHETTDCPLNKQIEVNNSEKNNNKKRKVNRNRINIEK